MTATDIPSFSLKKERAQRVACAAAPALPLRSIVRNFLENPRIIMLWRHRAASREALRSLEPRLLEDIGVTAEQAAAEAAKPFWRA